MSIFRRFFSGTKRDPSPAENGEFVGEVVNKKVFDNAVPGTNQEDPTLDVSDLKSKESDTIIESPLLSDSFESISPVARTADHIAFVKEHTSRVVEAIPLLEQMSCDALVRGLLQNKINKELFTFIFLELGDYSSSMRERFPNSAAQGIDFSFLSQSRLDALKLKVPDARRIFLDATTYSR